MRNCRIKTSWLGKQIIIQTRSNMPFQEQESKKNAKAQADEQLRPYRVFNLLINV
jgi:hypothetical protein